MNKSLIAIAVAGLMLFAGNTWSTDSAASRCQEWAKEDGVAAEEMQDYMAQCLEEQRLAEAEAGADPQVGDGNAAGQKSTND